jgi:hypothetical protein
MAQMPRGEPRSVPDPDGELYDEMIRQEKLKRALAEAGETIRWMEHPDVGPGLRRPGFSNSARNPIVTVDGRQIDTRCVVGGKVPVSQAELTEQRRAIERANYMAANPLAGAAYGIAALLGGSQQTRDRAMMAGGVVDGVMMGAAPRGVQMRGQSSPPRAQTAPPPLDREPIRPRETNSIGQAMGVNATLTPSMLGAGTRANRRLRPPGWQGDGDEFNEARGHLLAKSLGGTGRKMWNLVTLTQNGANQPQMSGFERAVADRVRQGEVVEYHAKPLYTDGILPPSAVFLTATGSQGAPAARLIGNPAGRPR